MSNKRKSSTATCPKIARTISFCGVEGYEILEFYDKVGSKFEYGKSGLVVELLKLYKQAVEIYGEKDALFKMRLNLLDLKNFVESRN